MRRIFLILIMGCLPVYGQAKTLINFDKGEISPSLARTVERTAPGQYTLAFTEDYPSEKIARIKKQLENQLKSFPQLNITEKKKTLIIDFKGPDTPFLKALSKIDVDG